MNNETLSQPVEIELDIPDDTSPEELEDALTRALKSASGEGEEVFESADELFAVEELENDGVAIEWPALPGFFVTFGHPESSRSVYSRKEREYRAKNKLDADAKLSPTVEEGLLRESFFGTAIKGWTELRVKGQVWPFDVEHYRKMWAKRRFRNWAMLQLSRIGTSNSPALEQVRGNL